MRKAADINVDDVILGNYGLSLDLPADPDGDLTNVTVVTRHRVTTVTVNAEPVLDGDQNVIESIPTVVVIKIQHENGAVGTLFLDPDDLLQVVV